MTDEYQTGKNLWFRNMSNEIYRLIPSVFKLSGLTITAQCILNQDNNIYFGLICYAIGEGVSISRETRLMSRISELEKKLTPKNKE